MAALSAAAAERAWKGHLLAFGDSLTEGFYNHGMQFHPYALNLERLLLEAGLLYKVHERGVSGELVTDSMVTRLPSLLSEAESKGVSHGWVIILGGINDIGYGVPPAQVYEGLKSMYGSVRQHGGKVLAMTCMETVMSRASKNDARAQLNALIRSVPGTVGFEHVTLLDLEKELPYPKDDADVARAALWDDGLHLTPEGYDEFGRIVFEAIKDKLS